MLDMKHKNIGATVGILKQIHEITSGSELPVELTKLFMLESDECDHKQHGCCFFEIDEPDACISPPKCTVGECPLGEIVSQELVHMSLSDITGNLTHDAEATYIGPCAGCGGTVTQENVGHVDDHHQVCKPCFEQKNKH